jgi:hypothetical protein
MGSSSLSPPRVSESQQHHHQQHRYLQFESLKSENELLRQKLQHMEIELEGTNAKLRILNKFSIKPIIPKVEQQINHPPKSEIKLDFRETNNNQVQPDSRISSDNISRLHDKVKDHKLHSSEKLHPPQQQQSASSSVQPHHHHQKSLSSMGSSAEIKNKSLIPIPVARVKKKNQQKSNHSNNNNFWQQWFGTSSSSTAN